MAALQTQFGVTQRRACRVVGQPRSTQRLKPPVPSDDELALRAFLRDFSKRRPLGLAAGGSGGQKGRVAGQSQADPPPLDRRRPACALSETQEATPGHRPARRGHVPDRAQRRLGAYSSGNRDKLVESLRWSIPFKGLARALVEQRGDVIELGLGVARQIGALWQKLANEAVPVLVCSSLPR